MTSQPVAWTRPRLWRSAIRWRTPAWPGRWGLTSRSPTAMPRGYSTPRARAARDSPNSSTRCWTPRGRTLPAALPAVDRDLEQVHPLDDIEGVVPVRVNGRKAPHGGVHVAADGFGLVGGRDHAEKLVVPGDIQRLMRGDQPSGLLGDLLGGLDRVGLQVHTDEPPSARHREQPAGAHRRKSGELPHIGV